jgi:lathosterol oxidase
MQPAMVFFQWAVDPRVQAAVRGQPLVVQFLEILVLTDLAQYWIHRAFHAVPVLWRFHRIHHSAETMDWLAGSRLHLVDVAVTRGLTYVPIYVLGFSPAPLVVYVAFVSAQATFIHANVRFRFGQWDGCWRRPGFTTGITAPKPKRSTRISPCTCP